MQAFVPALARLVRSSAEHFDGSGYPDGLAGEALAELRRSSGSQFDPRIVEALGQDLAEEATPATPSARA